MHKFQTFKTLNLTYHETVHIRGISPDMTLYVDEYYGADDWLAQHALTLHGDIIATTDEAYGRRTLRPLPLPADSFTNSAPRHTLMLNFAGPRHRGLREPERISQLARPLSIATRIALINRLGLDIAPPALLGVAESYVLAEAALSPEVYLVCRRLRLAYALAERGYTADHQPYDYDTFQLHVVHLYDLRTEERELPPETIFAGLPGVTLSRPMDCIIYKDHAFVADGGTPNHPSRIHVWTLHTG